MEIINKGWVGVLGLFYVTSASIAVQHLWWRAEGCSFFRRDGCVGGLRMNSVPIVNHASIHAHTTYILSTW